MYACAGYTAAMSIFAQHARRRDFEEFLVCHKVPCYPSREVTIRPHTESNGRNVLSLDFLSRLVERWTLFVRWKRRNGLR